MTSRNVGCFLRLWKSLKAVRVSLFKHSLQSFPPFEPALGLFWVIKAPSLFFPKSFYSAAGWLTFSNGDNIFELSNLSE